MSVGLWWNSWIFRVLAAWNRPHGAIKQWLCNRPVASDGQGGGQCPPKLKLPPPLNCVNGVFQDTRLIGCWLAFSVNLHTAEVIDIGRYDDWSRGSFQAFNIGITMACFHVRLIVLTSTPYSYTGPAVSTFGLNPFQMQCLLWPSHPAPLASFLHQWKIL